MLRSEQEIYNKLKQKRFSHDHIKRTVQYFKEIGLINDRQFAQKWILSRLAKPFGKDRIRFELKEKGIDTAIIEEELGQALHDYPEFDVGNWNHVKQYEGQDFDAIIHLAADTSIDNSLKKPEGFIQSNVNGLTNILRLARESKRIPKVIFPSTVVYGKLDVLPLREDFQCFPPNPYTMSKRIGELLCQIYAKNFNIPIIVLRIFNVYGKNQSPNFVIPKILDGLNKGRIEFKYTIESKRDWVYIKDVIQAFNKALEFNGKFEIFNIGTGKSLSVREILNEALDITQKKPELIIPETIQQGSVSDCYADISKAKNLLGWEPEYSVNKGLREIL